MGDLGGVTEVIMLMFGFFLYPISEHSYVMRATSRLFLARTHEGHLFEKPNDGDKDSKVYAQKMDKTLLDDRQQDDETLKKTIRKHRVIKISFLDNLKLYITKSMDLDCFDMCWSKRKKLKKLYEKG